MSPDTITRLDSMPRPAAVSHRRAGGGIRARIAAIGTANPATSYSQQDVLDRYRIEDRRICQMFLNSAIERRFLTLPPTGADGLPAVETQGELLKKHSSNAIAVGAQALQRCVEQGGLRLGDIAYLCCVTTTGFLTPGLSALLIKELGLRTNCARADIVGMGCNAGLNGLTAAAAWAQANPGKLAIMLCVEICSAAYVFDGTMRTAVVNSLFGDGAAAVALTVQETPCARLPTVLGFASGVVPEAIDAMRFDWNDTHGKFSFVLAQDVPYVVGANAERVIDQLLGEHGLRRSEIAHWLLHSGGKKVIDSVKVNLGLTAHDLRHTTSVLRDFGNMSSGSFLFSYERLLAEGVIGEGEYGVMMTMGPGATIEACLLHW